MNANSSNGCRYHRAPLVAALGAVLLVSSVPAASQSKAPAGKAATTTSASAKPTPKMKDGHPDLNGVWANPSTYVLTQSGNTVSAALRDGNQPYDPNDPDRVVARLKQFVGSNAGVVRREAAAKTNPNLVPPYKPELKAKVADLANNENTLDPVFHCHPPGVPRLGPPRKIIQTAHEMVFFYAGESGNYYRIIPTDGRGHNSDADPSYMGDSIAQWEGDTLVVDVTNFTEDSWIGQDGWFHSTAMHVIEHLSRNGDTLRYQVTVEDPNVFTEPWVEDARTIKLSTDPADVPIEWAPCIEIDSQHIVNHDRL